jgi:hypothetical protein
MKAAWRRANLCGWLFLRNYGNGVTSSIFGRSALAAYQYGGVERNINESSMAMALKSAAKEKHAAAQNGGKMALAAAGIWLIAAASQPAMAAGMAAWRNVAT